MKLQTILVPVDFSDHSRRALEYAIELAKGFKARLHLLHSYHVPIPASYPEGPTLPAEMFAGLRQQAETRLAELATHAKSSGLEVDTHLLAEDAVSAILYTAESCGADLIVMGSRGLTGIKHVVLGSVAERTLRNAPCPVLTVKAPEQDG